MIAWALATLVASSLLMLLVLMLRGPVRRAFGPAAAYGLWLLPAARMILPPLPSQIAPAQAPMLTSAAETLLVQAMPAPIELVDAAPAVDPFGALLLLWMLGAAGFVGWHMVTHARFCRRVLKSGDGVGMAEGCVRLVTTPAARGPLAFGVLRRYVAVPSDFADRYDPREQQLALAHELGHHARGDLLANWAALCVLGLHWWNPVAWRAYRAFRADQEMACDAMVLGRASAELRHAYGLAIVKSAHGGAVSAACHLHSVNELKGRLRMLSKHRSMSRRQRMATGAAIGSLALVGLGMTASGTQAAEVVQARVERTIGVDLADIALPDPVAAVRALQDAPVPPAPPSPPAAAPGTVPPVPPVPPVPADGPWPVPPVPPVPPAPPAIPADAERSVGPDGAETFRWTSDDGKKHVVTRARKKVSATMLDGGHPHVAVRSVREGGPVVRRNVHVLGPHDQAMVDIPQITSRDCGTTGDARQTVIHTRDGKRRATIICTDRIEKMASEAAEHAANAHETRRTAMASALHGLRSARSSVAANRDMPDAERREALEGIDEAIVEMEAEQHSDD